MNLDESENYQKAGIDRNTMRLTPHLDWQNYHLKILLAQYKHEEKKKSRPALSHNLHRKLTALYDGFAI